VSQQVRSKALVRMQWMAVILCAAAIAINYVDRSTIAIANPQIRSEFHISAAQFGALQSAWSLSFAVAQLPIGLMIDRLGPGMLLGVSLILWSLSVAAGGFASNYRQLFGARALLGVTESPAYPTAVRVTSNWFQTQDRGVPTGVFNMGANVGIAIAPPALTALMLVFGWRSMFIFMGVIGIVLQRSGAGSIATLIRARLHQRTAHTLPRIAHAEAPRFPDANGRGCLGSKPRGPWSLALSVPDMASGCTSPGSQGI